MKLNGKIFVVTGAGSGIGKELTIGLLDRGAKVAAVDLKGDELKMIKQKIDTPTSLSIHTLDIASRDDVYRLPADTMKAHGGVDGIINCAGIIQPFVKINDLNYEAVEKVMNVNFYGTLYMTKAFLPHLLKREEAHIVNVSSMGGFLPVPGQGVYGASKAAVKLMTEALYAELLDTKVHVSLVFPGATSTNITQNSGVSIPSSTSANTSKMSANMLSADMAAKIILDGIEKNKPQIFTGKDSKFMNKLYRLNPVFATKFIAKKMKDLLKSS